MSNNIFWTTNKRGKLAILKFLAWPARLPLFLLTTCVLSSLGHFCLIGGPLMSARTESYHMTVLTTTVAENFISRICLPNLHLRCCGGGILINRPTWHKITLRLFSPFSVIYHGGKTIIPVRLLSITDVGWFCSECP